MWFRYVVVGVFAVEALFYFLESRGKRMNVATPIGNLMAGIFYIAMAVLVVILIK